MPPAIAALRTAARQIPCSRRNARPRSRRCAQHRRLDFARRPARRPLVPQETPASLLRRALGERLRVLIDQLLDVPLQPHQHLLTDRDVQVDLDRLVGRLDRNTTRQRCGKEHRGEQPGSCKLWHHHLLSHFVVGGLETFTDSSGGVWAWLCCSSTRRTSVVIPGISSSGRGNTSLITWRGSTTDLAVAISARNGPLIVTFILSGIFE